jgi:SulP family sulfate permease
MGNMLSAGLCGPVGYSSVGKTMLCHSMGGHYFAGLFSLGYYAGYIVFGFYLARFIPLPVLGAFIFAIGMELLVEWLVHYRKKVTRVEYQETVVLFLIMTLNFVVGFFLGIFFSLIVFASRYADVPVIKAGERKSLLPCLLACFFPYLACLLACLSCDCASNWRYYNA